MTIAIQGTTKERGGTFRPARNGMSSTRKQVTTPTRNMLSNIPPPTSSPDRPTAALETNLLGYEKIWHMYAAKVGIDPRTKND